MFIQLLISILVHIHFHSRCISSLAVKSILSSGQEIAAHFSLYNFDLDNLTPRRLSLVLKSITESCQFWLFENAKTLDPGSFLDSFISVSSHKFCYKLCSYHIYSLWSAIYEPHLSALAFVGRLSFTENLVGFMFVSLDILVPEIFQIDT